MPELHIDLGELALAGLAFGPAQGNTLVAVHGWLDNAASFAPLAEALPEQRLLAVDLPGHGYSSHRPPGFGYHLVDYLWDLERLLDTFEAPPILLGHSLGAALVSLYAGLRPERVRALILIEGLGPLSDPTAGSRERLARALAARAALEGKARRLFASLAEAIAARRTATPLSEAAAAVLVERGLETIEGGYRWRSDPRLTLPSPLRLNEEQVLEILSGIRCPGLLILAEPSPPFLQGALEGRLAAVPDFEVERLPGSHHLHLEDPAPVAARIRDFLDRLPIETSAGAD